MSTLNAPHFHDADEARKYLERIQWPHGRVCPKCGTVDASYETKKPGVYRCAEKTCRKDFTVTVGTLFERSHIPLNKWLFAAYLIAASKKGMSAHQLSRMLDVTYKTAWFLSHRLREAMRDGDQDVFGRGGATVEVDETFLWTDPDAPKTKKQKTVKQMMKVVTLVEREGGRARSVVVDTYTIQEIVPIVEANLHREAHLMTDESKLYRHMGQHYASHGTVVHSKNEYVKRSSYGTKRLITTNTVEGFFSVFKRGMKGVYHHCAKRHLHRYLAEFDFRYSYRSALGVNDHRRADFILGGIGGKRLMYRACTAS